MQQHHVPDNCPHEQRPGTKVCLHCLREQRLVARARRRQRLGRLGGAALGLAVVAFALFAGASAIQSRRGSRSAVTGSPEATQRGGAAQQGEPRREQAVVARSVQPSASLAPAIGSGRTDLEDGVYVVRSGDTVEVHFDLPMYRTRRRDKFERMVRTTLPVIYGGMADSALAAVPDGTLTAGGDLLTELPQRGIRIPASGGRVLVVVPGTRPGEDGPLVVVYRSYIERAAIAGLASR